MSVIAGLMVGAFAVHADPVAVRSVRIALLVDATKLDAGAASFLKQRIEGTPKKPRLFTLPVRKGQRLEQIVEDYYGFGKTWQPNTKQTLLDAIRQRNVGIKEQFANDRGIRVPFFATVPDAEHSTKGTVQFFDLTTSKMAYVDLRDSCKAPEPGFAACTAPGPLRQGRAWGIVDSPKGMQATLAAMSSDVKKSVQNATLYYGVSPDPVEVKTIPIVSGGSPHAPRAFSRLSDEVVARIAQSSPGKLYVLDFFGNCDHGDKVVEVARATIEEAGLGSVLKVVQQQLLFKPDQPSLNLIAEYLRSNPQHTEEGVQANLTAIREQFKNNNNRYLVPTPYLLALFAKLLRTSDAMVVSSSFYVYADEFRILPPDLSAAAQKIFLAAAPNDHIAIEDFLYEPQYSFVTYSASRGFVLVGAHDGAQHPLGAYSRKGSSITCLAAGSGYGAQCIKPADEGSSFATPAVAAMILIAKSYWRSRNTDVSDLETRWRLLLASAPRDSLVGQYASGVPNFERLLAADRPFLVGRDGAVSSLESVSGTVSFQRPDGTSGSDSIGGEGFRGLALGATDHAIKGGEAMWKRIQVTQVQLTVEENGQKRTMSLNQFRQTYEEVIVP